MYFKFVYVHLSVYVYVYVDVCVYLYKYFCVGVCVCLGTCVYLYIYIYSHLPLWGSFMRSLSPRESLSAVTALSSAKFHFNRSLGSRTSSSSICVHAYIYMDSCMCVSTYTNLNRINVILRYT